MEFLIPQVKSNDPPQESEIFQQVGAHKLLMHRTQSYWNLYEATLHSPPILTYKCCTLKQVNEQKSMPTWL
jgi:hypothetical protein